MEEEIIQKSIQEVNITSLWYKDIYEGLKKVQDYERISRDGSDSIIEYVQVPRERLAEIQFQFMRMMITELDMLLGNTKILLPVNFYILTSAHIKALLHDVEFNPMIFISTSINQQNHTTNYFVTETYWDTLNQISKIRKELVSNLTPILYGTPPEKGSGMDKMSVAENKELIR
jgi:hypothetical protein